jgi:hypothetical protein
MSFEIKPTNDLVEITLPNFFISEFKNILYDTQLRIANNISNKYNIDLNDIIAKCFIDSPILSYTNQPTNNYLMTTSKDELNKYLVKDLKTFLSNHNLTTSGKKDILVNRLWDFLNKYKYKFNTVPIYINDDGNLCNYNDLNANKYLLSPDKKWIFSETNNHFQFLGILSNNKLIKCSPPDEIINLIH